jgi:hypothetical protein
MAVCTGTAEEKQGVEDVTTSLDERAHGLRLQPHRPQDQGAGETAHRYFYFRFIANHMLLRPKRAKTRAGARSTSKAPTARGKMKRLTRRGPACQAHPGIATVAPAGDRSGLGSVPAQNREAGCVRHREPDLAGRLSQPLDDAHAAYLSTIIG